MTTPTHPVFLDRPLETASRDQLAAHQLTRLRAGLGCLLATNPFYRARLQAAGLHSADDLRSLADLYRLPFTLKHDLADDQAEHPPYGTNLTEPLEAYVRLFQTSGTTGQPLRWLDTAETLEYVGRLWHVGLLAAGVNPADRIFYGFSFGPFLAFWGCWGGGHQLGALNISGGGLHTDHRIATLFDNRATVIACTPTYALRMAEVAAEQGVDLRAGPVRMTLHGGEPGASLPATKRRIEDLFGAKCMDTCGMTEIGHLGWECWAQAGLHLNEGDFVVEVVDPYSGLPVPPGRRGELVVTTLWRWASPVVRYRTGDVVELTHDPCICGRTYARALGGILGRRDDLLVVRGVNVFPSTLENLVRRHPEVAEFRIEAFRQRGMLELALQVECVPSVTSDEARDRLCGAIARDVRLATGLRLACTPVPPGTLPRFELKARRVVNLADDTNSPGFSTGSVDP